MSDTKERAAKMRNEMLDQVAERAERDLHDERFDWLRTTRARRGLVIATASVLVLYLTSNLLGWPFVTLGALITFGFLLWGLRLASRTIMDLPDELIDERMRARRGEIYRYAYMGAVCLLSCPLIVDIGMKLFSGMNQASALTSTQWLDFTLTIMFALVALPSMLFAWTEAEI